MTCPVCHHTQNQSLLTLEDYPIYQHPMTDSAKIPLPHAITLTYLICTKCSHAFQDNYDREILENIYAHHYYTPSPDSVAVTFRNDFIDFITQQHLAEINNAKVLEIGCSSGDVLSELKASYPQFSYQGVEPNEETAIAARTRGFDVSGEFFTEALAKTFNDDIDLIYSRHVIEHIFNFEDFFNAINVISHQESRLILETPSLDWATEQVATVAFHVEHIHVFSERSLVTLANQFGWFKDQSMVTTAGNLILSFTRIDNSQQLPEHPQNKSGLKNKSQALFNEMQDACYNKKVILWGAGSGALTLLALSKITPWKIIDGNPNKEGKFFCGIKQPICYAPNVVKELIANGDDHNILMIVSSSFYLEIEQELAQLGWRGEIYSPYKHK